jgi:hypothetical protein
LLEEDSEIISLTKKPQKVSEAFHFSTKQKKYLFFYYSSRAINLLIDTLRIPFVFHRTGTINLDINGVRRKDLDITASVYLDMRIFRNERTGIDL